ncbi:MAG: tetratricopeptide repeat protein [Bacteroidaceae bacterium]|nr:tetratricopeptide repeat protein [Bacteroidaceae bacterium]
MIRRILLFPMLLCLVLQTKAQVNTDHMMKVGRNALYFNDYVLSIQYFNQVVSAKPYLYEPYFFRGLAKFYLDDFVGSEADCSEAITRNPFVVDCYQIRGLARVNQEKYAEAIHDFRSALKYNPSDEGLWHNLSLCYAQLKEYDKAIHVLDTLVSLAPSYTAALNMRAQVHIQKEDTVAALEDLEASLQVNKYDSEVYATRALVYLKQERYEDADKDLTYAILLNPKSGYYINRALTRYNMQELRGAMADYDLALSIDPNNLLGHYNRGLLRAQVGDDNRAIEDFDFVVEYDPENTFALFNRALLLVQTGDWAKAETDLNQVLNEYPKFLYGYQCRADVRRKLGRLKEAEEDELVVLRAQLEEQNRLLAGGEEKEEESEEDKEENTRKESDKNIKKYKSLVVADDAVGEKEFTSDYRGKVQNRNVYVALQPLFALTYYNKESEVGRIVHYHRYLETLKRNKLLPLPLLVTASEQALDETRIEYHFADINVQSAKFVEGDEEGNAICYFARGLDFYIVQDLSAAIDDFTQAITSDGALWISYYSRAVARYKQVELSRADASVETEARKPNVPSDFMAEARINDYQLILADLNKAIDLAPDFAYTYYNRGNVLSGLKDYRAAIASYDEAIALEPNLAEAYYNRGLTYIFLGDNARGVADLSKAGELGLYSAYNLIKRFAE